MGGGGGGGALNTPTHSCYQTMDYEKFEKCSCSDQALARTVPTCSCNFHRVNFDQNS